MKTLKQACTPRPSVFESNRRDTVHDILDLVNDRIDPCAFFEENYITQGMRTLLTESFKRLEGKRQSQGVFHLSQAMGGGKTHNLIALGLLAENPQLRTKVMGEFYEFGPLDKVRVVAFTGRQTDAPYGIWGEIARQLGKEVEFSKYSSPLSAPGQEAWVNLLKGEPLIIMLDELPPYFTYAKSVAVGNSDLSVVTTAALANLLIAVADNKLENVVLVMTDLSGSSYLQGQEQIDQVLKNAQNMSALNDLNQEATRLAMTIDPVRMNTDEFYHILRARLFEIVPAEEEMAEVASAYAQSLRSMNLMDITSASPEQLAADIVHAYPFHPAIRDLYARFKENQGFQQTRALIRIMRIVTANLWQSEKADSQYLISAQDMSFSDPDIASELKKINSKLDAAIAHDVESQGSAVAELIDAGNSRDALDVSRLVFLSSLSTSTNQLVGLTRSEIVQYLVSPNRDVSRINKDVIDRLQISAWYMHANRDGRLYFKDVQNINAKLDSFMRTLLREAKEKELKKQLEGIFTPSKKDCYQKIQCLPAIDEIELSQDSVTLVVFRPTGSSLQNITDFYNQATLKNRVCFLTGDGKTYDQVLEAAAGLRAIELIMTEMVQDNKAESDPQMREAMEIQTKLQAKLYFAVKSSFLTLYYPSKVGLARLEMDLKYSENKFIAEDQIMSSLEGVSKYTRDISVDTSFRNKIENKLWPKETQEMPWSEIKLKAAQLPNWMWHVPNALDNLKTILVQRDMWRESGGYVDKGPFPQPKTDVRIQETFRDDDTGEATLKVTPVHGDRVYMEEGAPATTSSRLLESMTVITKEMHVYFLAVDTTGVHKAGDSVTWKNKVTVKHKFYHEGDTMMCELKAAPYAPIKYTTDGSNPVTNGGTYDGTITIPRGAKYLQFSANGGKTEQLLIPAEPESVTIALDKPYIWHHAFKKDATMETYQFLTLCKKYDVMLGGVSITVSYKKRFAELNLDSEGYHLVCDIETAIDAIKDFVPSGQIALQTSSLNFETGQSLKDMVADMKMILKNDEVKQFEAKS